MNVKIFVFNPVQENTYLLYDETGEALIIDCGAFEQYEQKQLKDFIAQNNLKLKYLLNTHLHFDHVLGNHFIYETYGIKPMYNETEESMPGLRVQAGGMGFPINYEPVFAEHFLKEGDIVKFGNAELKAILTPGHSPGSLSYYCEKDKCVFTGDALFQRDIGRTDLWGGNEETLLNAIRTKLLTLPDDTVIYPGHGPASTVEDEKRYNPYI